jgi:hypothetical protein
MLGLSNSEREMRLLRKSSGSLKESPAILIHKGTDVFKVRSVVDYQ